MERRRENSLGDSRKLRLKHQPLLPLVFELDLHSNYELLTLNMDVERVVRRYEKKIPARANIENVFHIVENSVMGP